MALQYVNMAIIQDFVFSVIFCILCFCKPTICYNTIQYCPFFNNRAPTAQPGLKNCTWYKENSCCMQKEIEETFGKVKPLKGASKSCQSYVNYLMCYICAPDQNTFYHNERLTVCEGFCNEFYEACGSAILKGSHIEDLYKNGTQFCLSRRFMVNSRSSCFSVNRELLTNSGTSVKTTNVFTMIILCTSFVLQFFPLSTSFISLFDLAKYNIKAIRLNSRISFKHSLIILPILLLSLPNIKCVGAVEYNTISQENIHKWTQVISEELHLMAQRTLGFDQLQRTVDILPHSIEYVNATLEIINMQRELRK